MARIPESNNSTRSLPMQAVDASQAGGVGRVLQGIGDMGRGIASDRLRQQDIAEAERQKQAEKEAEEARKEEEARQGRVRDNDAALAINEFTIQSILRRQEYVGKLSESKDLPTDFDGVSKKEQAEIESFIQSRGGDDPLLQEKIKFGLDKKRASFLEGLAKDVEGVQKEKRQLSAEQQVQELQKVITETAPGSPERAALQEQQANSVKVLLGEGIISAERAKAIIQSSMNEVAMTDARRSLSDDPYAFQKAIKDANQFQGLEPDQRLTLEFRARDEIQKRELAYEKQLDKQQKLLSTDPASYVTQVMGIKGGAEERIAAQKALGVAGVNMRAFTKEEAVAGADKINSIKDPVQLKATIDNVLANVGDEEARDIAFRDLEKAGLNGNARFMGYIPDSEPGIINAWADVMRVGEKEVFERAEELQGKAVKGVALSSDLNIEVNESLREYMSTINVSGANISRMNELTNKTKALAAYYITQGDSIEDATTKATRWITDAYNYTEYNGNTYRVPQDIDAGVVEDYADSLVRETSRKAAEGKLINPFPAVASGLYEDEIENHTVWVTNSNEDGLILMHETGFIIQEEVDGVLQPVTAKFSDAMLQKKDNREREEKEKQVRDEANQKIMRLESGFRFR